MELFDEIIQNKRLEDKIKDASIYKLFKGHKIELGIRQILCRPLKNRNDNSIILQPYALPHFSFLQYSHHEPSTHDVVLVNHRFLL